MPDAHYDDPSSASHRVKKSRPTSRTGLTVDRLYGGWHEGPFDPASSDEIVCKTRLA